MKNSKYRLLNKNFIIAVIFFAIGIIAAASLLIFGENPLGIGLFCGFFPTGLGLVIIELKTAKSADLQKTVEIKNEERNVFFAFKGRTFCVLGNLCYNFRRMVF